MTEDEARQFVARPYAGDSVAAASLRGRLRQTGRSADPHALAFCALLKRLQVGRADHELAENPIYMQIVDALMERIEQGDPAPGDRMAPERTLAEDSP